MLNFSLSEEQSALAETARRFARERIIPAAPAADRDAKFPREIFEEAWRLGLINTTVPAEYGGADLGELDNAIITEQLAYGCTGIQTSMLANTLAGTPIKLAASRGSRPIAPPSPAAAATSLRSRRASRRSARTTC